VAVGAMMADDGANKAFASEPDGDIGHRFIDVVRGDAAVVVICFI
jgi:hypothetical protein